MYGALGRMCDAGRLYWRYVSISIRSQMQYRASFIMFTIAHFMTTGIEFGALWVLFDHFGDIDGWELSEVALFYGMVNMGFAIAEAVARGFDTFAGMVKGGEFDRLLLRPRSTALQVAGRDMQLLRIGRFSQGLFVMLWAAARLDVHWSLARASMVVFAIAGGAALFSGLFVLQGTMCFWTIESLELMNTMTYGGVETTQYPVTIYRTWFRRFFTFFVPLACVTYYPALVVLDRADPLGSPRWLQVLSPLIGIAFLVVCLRVWRFGVRHYRSTGS